MLQSRPGWWDRAAGCANTEIWKTRLLAEPEITGSVEITHRFGGRRPLRLHNLTGRRFRWARNSVLIDCRRPIVCSDSIAAYTCARVEVLVKA